MDLQDNIGAQACPLIQSPSDGFAGQWYGPCPVIYFSGVTNAEMMDTYKILANKIYSETNGAQWPACAKAVPGAIGKSLEQVITEISGDHADAMRMSTSGADVDG
ncbi:hypothetical protein ACHAW5_005636 [Stephanodiscus triporus]|uniref:Uncharacterized protein n=1 Tax=Stephanodiscus triporus TaxID=2934178 RepID=A0ABD3MYR0_9STRA